MWESRKMDGDVPFCGGGEVRLRRHVVAVPFDPVQACLCSDTMSMPARWVCGRTGDCQRAYKGLGRCKHVLRVFASTTRAIAVISCYGM